MLIIPVLDLSHGLVVHAKQGMRTIYQPVTSVISSNPKPETVLAAFFKLYPFEIIYIADLDAIQGSCDQRALITELAQRFPACEFWVDAGLAPLNKQTADTPHNIKCVLGSENKIGKEAFSVLVRNNPDIVLSLDFNAGGLMENHYLLSDTHLWPDNIIVMMLHRVGLKKGVDLQCLQCLNNISNITKHNIYVAGGTRDLNDLRYLRSQGVSGVLLATALHDGSITQEDVHLFATA